MTDFNSRGEQWARQQLLGGKPIVFPEEWPENDRTISGAFVIEALLSLPSANSPDGILIDNAIISSHVYRRYLTCSSEVSFAKCVFMFHFELPFSNFTRRLRFVACRFNDHFNIHSSTFAELAFYSSKDTTPTTFHSNAIFMGVITTGDFLCVNCRFENPGGVVSFNNAKTTGIMSLERTFFSGPVDLAGFRVDSQLNCMKTQFLNASVPVRFNGGQLSKGAVFDQAQFMGGADFSALHVDRLQCVATHFHNIEQEVSFSTAVIDGPAILENCTFAGPVDFTSSTIRHDLYLKGSRFTNRQTSAVFTGIKISGSVFLDDCQLLGPLTFVVAHVGGQGSFNRSKFMSTANFQAIKLAGSMNFRQTQFEGTVDLSGADIDGQLIMLDDKFLNVDCGLSLNSSRIKRGFFLENSHVEGFLNCAGADIGGQVGITRTRFSSEAGLTTFSNAQIGGDLVIDDCQFAGPVSFASTNIIGQFRCTAVKFSNESQRSDFAGVHVQGSVVFWRSTFNGSVRLRNGHFSQNLSISTATFNKDIDLSNAIVNGYFYVFFIPEDLRINSETPTFETILPTSGNLNNFRFAGSDLHEDGRWKTWLALSPSSEYMPDPFLALEHSFRKVGRDDLADQVYYAMKVKEGHNLWERGRFDKWVGNQVLHFLVGHGVYGWWLWLWAIPLPLCFTFVCYYLHDTVSPFRTLFYAIDVFLPVDLHQTNICDIPEPLRILTELWGWIIIPLALAQLGGVLKKKEQ